VGTLGLKVRQTLKLKEIGWLTENNWPKVKLTKRKILTD
jgi:hypothetical protein